MSSEMQTEDGKSGGGVVSMHLASSRNGGREYVGVRAFKPEAAAPWQRRALAMLASAAAWHV
jgi:hypothetical protein